MEKGTPKTPNIPEFTPSDEAWFKRGERMAAADAESAAAQPVGGEKFSALEKAWFAEGKARELTQADLPLLEEYQHLLEKALADKPEREDAEALRYKLEKATEKLDNLRREQLSGARAAVESAGQIEVVEGTATEEAAADTAAGEANVPPSGPESEPPQPEAR